MSKYEKGKAAKCPHCLTTVRFDEVFNNVLSNSEWEYRHKLVIVSCPECKKIIITKETSKGSIFSDELQLFPFGSTRPPIPIEVPVNISDDYFEAALTLPFSPKASAALSRRCLQTLIREYFGIKKTDLYQEIQTLIDSGKLPPYLSNSIDAIRKIGKFAAHPNKSKTTGEIIQVEPEEAEWNLDVLESLFEFCYKQPAILEKKKEALDAKLGDIAK